MTTAITKFERAFITKINGQERRLIKHGLEDTAYKKVGNKYEERPFGHFAVGESVYDEDGKYVGYCPDYFDWETAFDEY